MKKSVTFLTVTALILSLVFCFYGCEDNIQLTSSFSSSSASLQSVVTSQASYEVSSVISDPTESELSAAHSKYYASRVESREILLYGTSSVTASMPDELPVYIDGSMTLVEREQEGYPKNRKYRSIFYEYPIDYATVIGDLRGNYNDFNLSDDMIAFKKEQKKIQDSGAEREEMLMVTLIKTFNITREEMQAVVDQQLRLFYYLDRNDERYEVPNLDIIYTLDNDIINEYYRYA